MQGKSIAKTVILALLILWAIYALWPTYQLQTMPPEKKAQMEEDGTLAPIKSKAIKMGLDLQGGMNLTYEVDLPLLFEELAEDKDAAFSEIMAQAVAEEGNEDFIDVLVATFKAADIPLNRYWGDRNDSDSKVVDYLQEESKDAINRALEKLRNRVDQFGVSEPEIQKSGSRRIIISLPGVSNPDEAKELIGRTALLEFRLLKDPMLFTETIQKIDKAVSRIRKDETTTAADLVEPVQSDSTQAIKKESKDAVVSVNALFGEDEEAPVEETAETAEDSSSILVDEDIFEENPFLALLRNLGQRHSAVGVPLENVKAVNKILQREDIQPLIPQDAKFLWATETIQLADKEYQRLYLVKKEAEITGKYLKEAKVTIGSSAKTAGQPVVNFTLNREGARIFSRVTGANIGKELAIVLDGKVSSSPVITTRIPNGSGVISGIGDMEAAKMTAIVLRVGALPAPINIIEERTVGPTLGQDSINRGSWSTLIGMGLIVLFMIFYYRAAGLIANTALLLNIILLMAVLVQFGFTLTLPGIAGIVLTIGMAVDANVLVFERIREELRAGKTVRAAIDAGYSRAFRTILDANITTLLTALVLYQFGSGPIRGFSVTLAIGIIVSMFTALVVTRMIFNAFTSRKTLTKLSI